jgi:hypothetical protein
VVHKLDRRLDAPDLQRDRTYAPRVGEPLLAGRAERSKQDGLVERLRHGQQAEPGAPAERSWDAAIAG